MEEWKTVQGYDDYEVSNLGVIRNSKGKILKIDWMKNGYGKVYLYKNKRRYMHYIHRVVAQHFVPNPENKPEVNHDNSIKTDNRAANLVWSTRKENVQHSIKYGLRHPVVTKMRKHIKALECEIAELKQMVGG